MVLSKVKKPDEVEIQKKVGQLIKSSESHFKNYQLAVDREVFIAMMTGFCANNSKSEWPEAINDIYDRFKGNYYLMAEDLYDNSIFCTAEKTSELLNDYKSKNHRAIEKDPAYRIASGVMEFIEKGIMPRISVKSLSIDSLMRIYMKAQMEMQPMKKFYPDANFTLRVSYGNILGYQPDDAVSFKYFTTLDGIFEKEDPDVYDYVVENKLKELYRTRDFGQYGNADGKMQVCFTATNHTSGGNSGSPVLDANGNLIGLNFDRCWEGTMSDLVYDISQCRNIALDIRYCLFIIDKFAGAKHLIDEMTLLKNQPSSPLTGYSN